MSRSYTKRLLNGIWHSLWRWDPAMQYVQQVYWISMQRTDTRVQCVPILEPYRYSSRSIRLKKESEGMRWEPRIRSLRARRQQCWGRRSRWLGRTRPSARLQHTVARGQVRATATSNARSWRRKTRTRSRRIWSGRARNWSARTHTVIHGAFGERNALAHLRVRLGAARAQSLLLRGDTRTRTCIRTQTTTWLALMKQKNSGRAMRWREGCGGEGCDEMRWDGMVRDRRETRWRTRIVIDGGEMNRKRDSSDGIAWCSWRPRDPHPILASDPTSGSAPLPRGCEGRGERMGTR